MGNGSRGLGWLEFGFRAGTFAGAAGLFLAGGFVPVTRRWLNDELNGWADVPRALGGVWVDAVEVQGDGPAGIWLGPADAPELFREIRDVARAVGTRPPAQVRLVALPCCGAASRGRGSRADERSLWLGLPLLAVLSPAEFRAALAHELAHLAGRDAARATRAAAFLARLAEELDANPTRGPLGAWARACRERGARRLAPIVRGLETRADRVAARVAGGPATASALIAAALAQILFHEALAVFNPERPGESRTVFAFFRAFWRTLDPDAKERLRLGILARNDQQRSDNPTAPEPTLHPPIPQRVAAIQDLPDPRPPEPDHPATDSPNTARELLGDPEFYERLVHNLLYGLREPENPEPSLFRPARGGAR